MAYEQDMEKLHKRMAEAVCMAGCRLPPQVCALFKDDGKTYVALFAVSYEDSKMQLRRKGTALLREGMTPSAVADDLIENFPGTSLICDEGTAQRLAAYSLSFMVEGRRHRLLARPKGFLEVYAMPL